PLTYESGHRSEPRLSDAAPRESAVVRTPDGARVDRAKSLEKVSLPARDGKNVTAFRLTYQPRRRGDHVFLFASPPVWMADEKHFLQDRTKVILHVETQIGWDGEVAPNKPDPVEPAEQLSEVLPLTRPYGLTAGMAFRVEVPGWHGWRYRGRPAPAANTELPPLRALVEVERFTPAAPKHLPADEHITRTARTDAAGTATVTLSEPG